MHAFPKAVALILFAAGAHAASASCYMVYAPDNTVVFRSMQPPVDLSKPLHVTMPAVAPGGKLVFSPDSYGCEFESNKLDTLHKVSAKPASARHSRRVRRARGT